MRGKLSVFVRQIVRLTNDERMVAGREEARHPQLAASAEGLELTDVSALTTQEDAGLEINQIGLVPQK